MSYACIVSYESPHALRSAPVSLHRQNDLWVYRQGELCEKNGPLGIILVVKMYDNGTMELAEGKDPQVNVVATRAAVLLPITFCGYADCVRRR